MRGASGGRDGRPAVFPHADVHESIGGIPMSARRGVLILVVLFLVTAGAMFYVFSTLGTTSKPRHTRTMLVWDVPYDLPEAHAPVRGFSLAFSGLHSQKPTVFEVTQAIRHAAEDTRVRSMVLHIETLGWGWAKVEEVREALVAFRATGKPLYATMAFGGEREYLLASAAETIGMQPADPLQLDGLAAGAMFFRGALDKLGVTPNFEHVGEYKSAVEQYTRKDLSPAGRVAEEAVIDDLYGAFLEAAAGARGMEVADMRSAVEAGPYLPFAALEAGLIDTVLYRAQLDTLAATQDGGPLPDTDFDTYTRASGRSRGPKVALLVASGVIAPGRSQVSPYDGEIAGSETLIDAIRDIREDGSIEGLVLRIDSPGGSVQASDEILGELLRCRKQMPVVVTMSDLAASGGYYIAMAADSIVAQPTTQTGSIGIYGGKMNISGLFEKLGLSIELFTRGPNATLLSPYADWSDAQRALFHAQLESHYANFLAYVAENRGITLEEADSLGRGRVWSGVSASRIGLIDGTGGFTRAFEMIRGLAGIEAGAEVQVLRFPRTRRTFLTQVVGELFNEDELAARTFEWPRLVRAWMVAARFPAGTPVAIIPWVVDAR
jgi:protease-4